MFLLILKPEETLDDIVDSISSMAIMPEKNIGFESYKIEDSSKIEDPNLTVPNADGQQNNTRSRKTSFNSDSSSGRSNVSQALVYYLVCHIYGHIDISLYRGLVRILISRVLKVNGIFP